MNLFRNVSAHPPLSNDRLNELKGFEKRMGLRFRDHRLLNQAFSHRSYTNESPTVRENNERLEFLGDSVLGLVVSTHLFQLLPDRPEGDLAKIKSIVVSEESLSELALQLGIPNFLLMGRGEDHSGGRQKKAILADALEAVIGAAYLDLGFEAVQTFILKHLGPEVVKVLEDKHKKDYKTLLQEHVQKYNKTYPRYMLAAKVGPDHDRIYHMEVVILGEVKGRGVGKSKKEAEQAAAAEAWKTITGSL